jgi:hypothetical protein
MFVRWKRDDVWYPHAKRAVLVESHRVDGKPRQRFVAYLGSIDDRNINWLWARRQFWYHANKALLTAELRGQVTYEQVLTIKQTLAVRVAPAESEATR